MTESPDDAAKDDVGVPHGEVQRGSVWSRLNRTNRIAALIVGGIAAAIAAVAVFGAGILVGTEMSGDEGHRDGVESSDYNGDNQDASDGESERDGDREGADAPDADRGENGTGEQPQPKEATPPR
jgi:hypothetical protein